MELMAVIYALEALSEPCQVELYSDSKYVIDAITKGWVTKWKANNWKRNKKEKAINVDLWEKLLPLLDMHDVSFVWVKGHADNANNNHCDYLARTAITEKELLVDFEYEKLTN